MNKIDLIVKFYIYHLGTNAQSAMTLTCVTFVMKLDFTLNIKWSRSSSVNSNIWQFMFMQSWNMIVSYHTVSGWRKLSSTWRNVSQDHPAQNLCVHPPGNWGHTGEIVWIKHVLFVFPSDRISRRQMIREAFKNKNDETYGIFHMLVDPPPPTNIWKILSWFFIV